MSTTNGQAYMMWARKSKKAVILFLQHWITLGHGDFSLANVLLSNVGPERFKYAPEVSPFTKSPFQGQGGKGMFPQICNMPTQVQVNKHAVPFFNKASRIRVAYSRENWYGGGIQVDSHALLVFQSKWRVSPYLPRSLPTFLALHYKMLPFGHAPCLSRNM